MAVVGAVASAAMVLFASDPARGQTPTDTWVYQFSGNWNVGSNWLGGIAPPTGGGTARILRFNANQFGFTATNNLGAPFVLNGLMFDTIGSGNTITIASAAGNSLQFGGSNPFVVRDNAVNVVISSGAALGATTTLGGAGYGSLNFSGAVSGGVAAGGTALIINGGGVFTPFSPTPAGAITTLSGANTFTGNVNLVNGNLVLGTSAALGLAANALVVNAGTNTVSFSATGLTVPNPVTANGTVMVAGSNGATFSGAVSGAGGLTVTAAAAVTLTAANGYGGPTTVGMYGGSTATGLTLSGAGGLSATSSVLVTSGATLSLVNGATSNSTDRVADAAPQTLQNGRISFTAAPSTNAASGETFGPLTVQGTGTLTVTAAAQSGTSSVLHFGPLSLVNNGTLFIQNTSTTQSVGGGAAGPNRTNVFVSGGLPTISDPAGVTGGVNTPVVPFLSGSLAGTAANVMGTVGTYDANGVRLLNPTDTTVFAQPGSALIPHANNNLTAYNMPVSGTTTVTSIVGTGSSGTQLTGSGTVQVASGVVVAATPMSWSGPTLAFGTATGYLQLGANVSTGPITGSGGVVVSSANARTLLVEGSSGNSFTGGLFVNGNAIVDFSADSQLGAAGGAVTLNGGTLAFNLQSADSLAASRAIVLGPAGGTMNRSSIGGGAPLTVLGPISGPGGLTLGRDVTLAGANSYVGPTIVRDSVTFAGTNSGGGPTIITSVGQVNFTSPANFSSGPIVLNGGILNALAGGSFNRDLTTLSSNSQFLVPPGQMITFGGTISGPGGLNVGGGGTLIVSTPVTAAGLSVGGYASLGGGTLVLTGGAFHRSGAAIADGGVLVIDDTAGGAGRFAPTSPISIGAGEVQLVGGGTATTETVGPLTVGGTITIIPGAGTTATLSASQLTIQAGSTYTLFRGENLGGSAAESAHIYVAGMSPGTVIPNALADTSPTGLGQEQAAYGTAGIRLAVASDFVTGPVIQNAAPTNTPTTADFRVVGTVTTAGSANTIRTLRLEPGGSLAISPGTLTLSSQFVFAAAGGAASISGPGSISGFTAFTAGDLAVSAPLTGVVSKYGPGTLTLSGGLPASFGLAVNAGTVVLNNGQVSPVASLGVTTNLVLATPATGLQATGQVVESAGTVISGPGSMGFNPSSATTYWVNGANTYSGGTTAGPNATFLIFHPSALGTGPVTLATTNGTTSPATLMTFNFGNGTFANDINLPTTNSFSQLSTFHTSDAVTLSGKISGGNATAGTALQFNSFSDLSQPGITLTNPANDFTATVVVGGPVAITSNAALGNPANAVQLGSGILRLAADGIIMPRPITTNGGYIDTQGYHGEVSGVVSGAGPLTKLGTGTLILSGANTLNGGLQVYAGTVDVTGSGSYDVTLFGGAIGGTGVLHGMVTNTGAISPGVPTATGRLTVTNFVGISFSTFTFRIDGPTPGDGVSAGGYDQLVSTYAVAGGMNVSGNNALSALVGGGFDPTVSQPHVFLLDDASPSPIGTFTGLPNGAFVNLGAYRAQISYFGNAATNSITGANDIVLYNFQVVSVPEPSSLLLAAAATAAVVRARRRRRAAPAYR
jgi:autotransporter-associated beta strand protein